MPVIKGPGGAIEVDDRGYLTNAADWTPELATVLAAREGIRQLSPDHWRVLDALRGHWDESGKMPLVRQLCTRSGLTLGRVYELFPKGPAQDACRVAGLPKPDTCV
jgi:dissimilatory sulfite reductase related protein